MSESFVASPGVGAATGERAAPAWQRGVEWTAALLLAAVWFVAGLWKLSDLTGTELKMTQALVPRSFAFLAALLFGTAETFAGVLLLAPRWRRWGALLSFGLLAAFMGYIGVHYGALRGADCTCFPWLKRAIGPMFFVEDAALMLVAVTAGIWTKPSSGWRRARLVLAAILVFAGAMHAWNYSRSPHFNVPPSILVDGKEFPLQQGRAFLFFLNPYCPHCFQAAQDMSKLNWQGKVIGVPTQAFEEAPMFFQSAGWSGIPLSPDLEKLRQAFPFQDVPYAVAIEEGRVVRALVFFDEPDLSKTLREIGFVK